MAGRLVGMPHRGDLEDLYRRYNAVCNAHDFDRLGDFVAESLLVNGERQTRGGYAAGLRQVVHAFPDYRWDLRHLLIDGDWIAAHFADTGTHRDSAFGVPATGRVVRTQEFAFYRIETGKIAEVWVTADDLDLLTQLRD
jgi:steroid delta-isomerase-like uncharacterized protein